MGRCGFVVIVCAIIGAIAGRTEAEGSHAVGRLDGSFALARGALDTVRHWISPPIVTPKYSDDEAHYYHGTSFDALFQIAADGGELRVDTNFSSTPYYAETYARSKARLSRTPGVVLQFPREALQAGMELSMKQPGDAAPFDVPQEPLFFTRDVPTPLSAMTPAAKRALLDWIERERAARPDDLSLDSLVARFHRLLTDSK